MDSARVPWVVAPPLCGASSRLCMAPSEAVVSPHLFPPLPPAHTRVYFCVCPLCTCVKLTIWGCCILTCEHGEKGAWCLEASMGWTRQSPSGTCLTCACARLLFHAALGVFLVRRQCGLIPLLPSFMCEYVPQVPLKVFSFPLMLLTQSLSPLHCDAHFITNALPPCFALARNGHGNSDHTNAKHAGFCAQPSRVAINDCKRPAGR